MKHILLPFIAILFLASCRTTKHITTAKVNVDSTVQSVRDSFNLAINTMKLDFFKEITSQKNMGVEFDNECPPCPVTLSKDCNADSVIKVNKAIADENAKLRNKIKVNADGSFEAEGRIKSYKTQLTEKDQEISQLTMEKQELASKYEQLLAAKSVTTETKVKDVKRSGLALWWLAVAAVIGAVVWHFRKLLFITPFNFIKMKLFAVFFVATMLLTGCADFHDEPGKSVWSDGGWILPWLTGLASVFFFYVTYRKYEKSKVVPTFNPRVQRDSPKRISVWKVGQFWFAIALAVATVIIILSVVGNR